MEPERSITRARFKGTRFAFNLSGASGAVARTSTVTVLCLPANRPDRSGVRVRSTVVMGISPVKILVHIRTVCPFFPY
jgi:hypothetical protein